MKLVPLFCSILIGSTTFALAKPAAPGPPTPNTALAVKPLDTQAANALQTIRQASDFALGGVGFAGVLQPATKAYFSLLEHPQGTQAFMQLWRDPKASPEARAFALAGLSKLEPAQFREAQASLAKQKPIQVRHFRGCIRGTETLTDVVKYLSGLAKKTTPKPSA